MNNTGSLYSIYLLDCKYLLGIVFLPLEKRYQIQLDPNAVIDKVPFTLDTANFKQTRKKNTSGVYFQVELTCLVPKISPEFDAIFDKYDNENFVAIIKDSNDYFRLIGNQDEPLFFSEEKDTGTDFADPNTNKIDLSRQFRKSTLVIKDPF